jgi:lactoylglutathione lyase
MMSASSACTSPLVTTLYSTTANATAATVPTAYSAVLIPASTEARSVLIRRLILLKKFMSSANNKPHRVTADRSDLWMAEQLVDHPPISIRVLGFVVVRDKGRAALSYLALGRDEDRIGAAVRPEVTDHDQRRPPIGVELVLEVDDLDASRERVRTAGWAIVDEMTIQPWGLRDFRLLDRDGYYLRITQHAPDLQRIRPCRRRASRSAELRTLEDSVDEYWISGRTATAATPGTGCSDQRSPTRPRRRTFGHPLWARRDPQEHDHRPVQSQHIGVVELTQSSP